MKTYSERLVDVTERMRQIRHRRTQKRMAWAVASAAVLTLVLFFPLNVEPPNVRAYSDSPYYELIKEIDRANGGELGYKNLFTAIVNELGDLKADEKEPASTETPVVPPTTENPESSDDRYINLNFKDDSLPGMTDGDVVLYTDDYIFRLSYNVLKVFNRDGEESKKISEHRINAKLLYVDGQYEKHEIFGEDTEMFLSEDGKKITVLISVILKQDYDQRYTLLVQLDVSDPMNIRQIQRYYVSGWRLGAWMMGDELLIATEQYVGMVSDYSAVDTYIPMTGYAEQLQPIPAEDIVLAGDMTKLQYFVLYKVGLDSLQVNDQLAVITRGQHIRLYITEEYLFTAYDVAHPTDDESSYFLEGDVACFRYRDGLTYVSSATLPGGFASIDMYNGVLRMITAQYSGRLLRYSLYCLDMPELGVISVTEDITPGGRPGSVTFRGDLLSFQNRGFTSGVYGSYVYDLSDPKKVTIRQGEIAVELEEKLVKWTDGYWLGISKTDEEYQMVLELFTETDAGLCSAGKHQVNVAFASDRENLYVDPERGLLGMYVRVQTRSNQWTNYWADYFILLQFADGQWTEVTRVLVSQHRVLPLDGWIYLVYNDIQAIPLG